MRHSCAGSDALAVYSFTATVCPTAFFTATLNVSSLGIAASALAGQPVVLLELRLVLVVLMPVLVVYMMQDYTKNQYHHQHTYSY